MKTIISVISLLATILLGQPAEFRKLAADAVELSGFTHVGRFTYLDLTNSVLKTEFRWPTVGYAPVGSALATVGVYLSKPFMSNQGQADSNVCALAVGTWGSYNAALQYRDLGSNYLTIYGYTNALLPSIVTASTQAFVSSFTFTNVSVPATITNGEVYIYLRIVPLNRAWQNY